MGDFCAKDRISPLERQKRERVTPRSNENDTTIQKGCKVSSTSMTTFRKEKGRYSRNQLGGMGFKANRPQPRKLYRWSSFRIMSTWWIQVRINSDIVARRGYRRRAIHRALRAKQTRNRNGTGVLIIGLLVS